MQDPTKTADTIAKMAADPDPAMQVRADTGCYSRVVAVCPTASNHTHIHTRATQDLFRRAKAGEKEAVFDLQDRFNDIHFPGAFPTRTHPHHLGPARRRVKSHPNPTITITKQQTGVDARVLREMAANHNFDKLLSMPEVMRFIDRDETLAKVFRDPDFLKNGKEFFGTGSGSGSGGNGNGNHATTTFNSAGTAANKEFADAFEAVTGTPIGGEQP